MIRKLTVFLLIVPMVVMAGLEVKKEKQNVVAGRLTGKWQTQIDLTAQLNGTPVYESTYTFTEDSSIADKVPEAIAAFLTGKQIYLAGIMTHLDKNYPFILTEFFGNPYLIYFRSKGNDPMGDTESFNLILAPAADPRNDLLFIGGDFNNQPFRAFMRVEE